MGARPGRAKATASAVVLALVAVACAWAALGLRRSSAMGMGARVVCRGELRSWVVLGQGRHLYLQIECPPPLQALSGRVEFTSVMLRSDYRYTRDDSGRPRVGLMRGGIIRPPAFAAPPDNRLEAAYELTPEQVRCLRRDRVFEKAYVLVGANSNAAMRRVAQSCGVALPPWVLAGGGVLGEFPGIDADVGEEIAEEEWGRFGVGGTGTD